MCGRAHKRLSKFAQCFSPEHTDIVMAISDSELTEGDIGSVKDRRSIYLD